MTFISFSLGQNQKDLIYAANIYLKRQKGNFYNLTKNSLSHDKLLMLLSLFCVKNADCCSIHYSGWSYLQSTSIWSIIISTYYILLTYALCIFNHHKYRQKGSQKLLVLTQSVFKTWLLLDCHLIWGKYLLAIFRTLRSLASFGFSRLSVYYVMLSRF